VATLKRQVEKHEGTQARSALLDRGGAAMQLIMASLRSEDVEALAEEVATAATARPYPAQGAASTAGGRCRLQGLRGAPELNGQVGRIIGWNADGRRRYGVQLDSGQQISCQVRNAVAFDKPELAFPHDFDCTSAELVGKLQARLRAAGSERVVLDWTPLVAAVADVVYLLHVAHDIGLIAGGAAVASWAEQGEQVKVTRRHDQATETASAADLWTFGNGNAVDSTADSTPNAVDNLAAALGLSSIPADAVAAGSALIFVMSTPETAPFFLAHREFFAPRANMHLSAADTLAAVPWLTTSDKMTMVPSPWEQCCKRDYVVRLCLNLDEQEFTCPICQEPRDFADNPSQLPCAHHLCTGCLKQLSPPISVLDRLHAPQNTPRGLTCPVCRTHFAKHAVGEFASAPGGVGIFEHMDTSGDAVRPAW